MRSSIPNAALTLLVLATWTAAGRTADDPPQPPPVTTSDGVLALKGFDPVLLTRGREVKGDERFTLVRAGLRYRFADAANRAAFAADPARYEVRNDGQCAGSPTVKGDPSVFAVHKGRIYVFYCEMCKAGFLKEPDKYTQPRRTVAVYLHDGVELLDFAGPGEVFSAADSGRAFRVVTVAADRRPITSQGFLTVTPQFTFADCPKPDVLVLPGGTTELALNDPQVVEWVKKASAGAEVTLSVCTGAFILAKAGLLDGKEATTHWKAIDRLKAAAPKTTVRADRRVVDTGKVVTAAGVSAGIDGALHVVGRLLGEPAATDAARYMEYHASPLGATPKP